ncbi:MAG: PaaI family thioesterase [Polaribacter sp.]|nr:PaaI family thioesterase [Polaribacter sp.]
MLEKSEILKRFNERCKDTLMETLEIEYVDVGDDFVIAQMPVNSRVYQPYGILHGGATAALAESVGSLASTYFVDNDRFVIKGIELSINHVKSVKDGMVTATATIVHKGRSTHLWEIKVVNTSGDLISIAKITNIVLEKR